MSDPTALAGLRRLVLHAQSMLDVTRTGQPTDDHGSRDERAEAWAAAGLAIQVLQLVADCLPADEPDAAAAREREDLLAERHYFLARHAAALAELNRGGEPIDRLNAVRKALKGGEVPL